MAEHTLSDFLVPITCGLTPIDARRLSRARAKSLDARLRELVAARERAWREIAGTQPGVSP